MTLISGGEKTPIHVSLFALRPADFLGQSEPIDDFIERTLDRRKLPIQRPVELVSPQKHLMYRIAV